MIAFGALFVPLFVGLMFFAILLVIGDWLMRLGQ